MSHEIEIPVIAEGNLPNYASEEASGADVCAHLSAPYTIPPHESALIPTGLRFAIPAGYEIQVRPRSGLALKYQLTILNTPGTIDADYRGEVKIILINHGDKAFVVEPGMRIAQLVIAPVVRARFMPAHELTTSGRAEGGFGHTGF